MHEVIIALIILTSAVIVVKTVTFGISKSVNFLADKYAAFANRNIEVTE